jgi:hypothetical protein
MPVVYVPIKTLDRKRIIGVAQVIYLKALSGLFDNKK